MPNGSLNTQLLTLDFNGAIAQLVEQRTENPCVPGSIPGGTTKKTQSNFGCVFFYYIILILPLRKGECPTGEGVCNQFYFHKFFMIKNIKKLLLSDKNKKQQ